MKPQVFNIILGILASIIVIAPFTGKVHDARKRFIKSFTIRGWIIITAFFSTIIVNYFKDLRIEQDDRAKLEAAKIQKRKDDSISRKRNDESNAKIVDAFTTSLAKYGLKYDSAENVIKKLVIDSSKKQIIYGNHPELSVSNIEIKKQTKDSLVFNIVFFTKQAAAYHTTIKVYMVFDNINKPLYFITNRNSENFANNIQIPLDKGLQLPQVITGTIEKLNGTFYFIFIGGYSDLDGKKFPFRDIESYNLITKEYGPAMEPRNSEIIELLHQRGLNY